MAVLRIASSYLGEGTYCQKKYGKLWH